MEKITLILENESVKKIYRIVLSVLFSLYIFSIPTFSDIKPFNIVVYVLFALFASLTLFYIYFYKQYKTLHFIAFAFVPFFLISALSTIIYSHAFRLLLTVFLITGSIAVLFVFYQIIDNTKIILLCFLTGFTLFAILFSIYYRYEIIGFLKGEIARIALDNHFANVNTIGAFMVGLFTISFYQLLFYKNKLVLINIPIIFLSIGIGIMTGSRMFVITFVLSMVLLIIFRFKKRPIMLLIILSLLVLCFVFLLTLPVFNPIKRRFVDMWNMLSGEQYSSDFSTATRFLWQNYGLYLGSKHFFFGLGLDGFAVFSGTGTYSHANIFELICNVGVFGFLSYYLVWFLCFKQSFKISDELKWLVITLVCVSFVKGFFTVDYYSKFNAFIISFALYAAYPYAKKIEIKKEAFYYALLI